jgi:hypothetical protein
MIYTSKALSVMEGTCEQISVLCLFSYTYDCTESLDCFHKIIFRFITLYIVISEYIHFIETH